MTGCPHLEDLNPLDQAVIDDPYQAWDEARDQAPVVYIPLIDRYLAVSYDAVRSILRNTAELSSRDVIELGAVPPELEDRLPHGYPIQYPALINADPPRHTFIRKLAQQAFTVARVNAMEPTIREIAHGLIDDFAGEDEVELMAEYAFPLSTVVLCRMLGVPTSERARFREFSDTIVSLTSMVMPAERRVELSRTAADFYDYVTGLVEARRDEPADDLFTALLQAKDPEDGSVLSELSVISIVAQLIVAGHETTSTLIGNAIWLLLEDRARWEQVGADRELVPAAIEESLRRMAPIKHLTRTATQDVEIDGVVVPKGARVMVGFGAANTDSKHFSEPLRFDLTRSDGSNHVAFGRGTHFCLGAPLARLEGRIALECLLERVPDLRLSSSSSPRRARALSVYAFSELPLAL
jgi:cytochrome P450